MAKPEKTDQGRARARKADKVADKPPEPADTRTRGQVLLSAVEGTVREVAAKAGLGRSAISDWKTGKKVPGDDARATLEQAFGIPRRAWDELASAPAPSSKSTKASATATPSPRTKAKPAPAAQRSEPAELLAALEDGALPPTLAMVDEQITILRSLHQPAEGSKPLTASESIRVAEAIGKLTGQRAKLEEAALDLEARLVGHPTWVRLKALLRQLLLPHPELLETFNEHLTAWGDE